MEYVGYALSPDCQPDKFDGELAEETLDRSVLDDRCQAVPNFLSKAQELLKDDFQLDSNTKQLLSVLAESLSRFNMSEQTFVLSLSGGVDSMSLLVLLLKLKIKFAAVHIRHSSRLEDTAKELQWVQFVCKTLGVTLYYHHVLVARPHATSDVTESELSREAFEDYTRQIRFGMYRKAFDQYSTNSENSPALVLIGHHLDDIDENRIAELGKGNLINIDGMAEDDGDDGSSDKKRGVVVLRPLCSFIRKDQLRQFAQTFNIPHMRNSTPKWSKRGWIRDALDDPSFDRDSTLEQLDSLGRASRDLDQSLDTAVERWLELGGITCERTMHVISKSEEFSLSCSALHLGALESELADVLAQMRKVGEMCNDFSSRWNLKVEEFCRNEDRKNMSCPIQKIRFWNIDDETEFRTVILTRAFQKAFIKLQSAIPGLERYIAKKSMGQLVENLSSKSMKAWINWKLNNFKHEVPIIQYAQGNLAFPDCDQVDSITEELFAGNREALKKTIASNIHRITIS